MRIKSKIIMLALSTLSFMGCESHDDTDTDVSVRNGVVEECAEVSGHYIGGCEFIPQVEAWIVQNECKDLQMSVVFNDGWQLGQFNIAPGSSPEDLGETKTEREGPGSSYEQKDTSYWIGTEGFHIYHSTELNTKWGDSESEMEGDFLLTPTGMELVGNAPSGDCQLVKQ